ncbi:MAG: protein-export membrane protein SecD [Spirochaetes bacterium GWD1_61_31]|nr:MAG: protein-export membrane protein SecD [Spirochaetes bacterium GWB1_60_80]OHD28582.1 MAG: protein-export membrane protein SecD [Spirochaetes bacterium GWC1_61_12]OHD39439.1 MAG: protein-export membrane protein SecD [Spirochaetes bacterium GWD1_61_31]OHD45492.1 MAG: protein-export membrane protein SecD [Spirochaetes bacterium GWE1_60_18]OHD58066.1 MAG: protein-export membrane protein SecD [Spirochaetes bacterium GWF1_60_12]HAP44633.1 protein translocase subunit SecD [Spirochaetaceae bacte
MSKTKRFLIVLAVIAVAVAFLSPSIRWYYLTAAEDKALALGSREQIRDYAWRMARSDFAVLEQLALSENTEELPAQFDYLVDRAATVYRQTKLDRPETWNIQAIRRIYRTRADLILELEDYYRSKILDIKSLHTNAVQLGLDLSGGMSVVIRADLASLAEVQGRDLSAEERDDAVVRALEVLNNRIDQFGLTEPVIRRQGTEHIYVEIPGAADPERINAIIMGRGKLAFHIENSEATAALEQFLQTNPDGIATDNTVTQAGILPDGFVARKVYRKDTYGLDEWTGRYAVVTAAPGLDGNYIETASVSSDPLNGKPVVVFSLNAEGAELFYQLTSANLNKPMAVLLDDRIRSIATIQSAIRESGQISGFDADEAANLALVLRAGALPVELVVESQQAIGASLGSDAIMQGTNAVLAGLLAVFAFLLLFYKGAGINATMAQVLNLFFMLSILSAFNLTLTLPAIAGFVLTVGMAVDANVIIFERIKEELRQGKGRRAAIQAGFNKAFWAVFDGNITTIIAAAFLSQLGTGPIRGFAISLLIGNVSSLFTALFVSRLMFDFNTDVFKRTTMSISWRVK